LTSGQNITNDTLFELYPAYNSVKRYNNRSVTGFGDYKFLQILQQSASARAPASSGSRARTLLRSLCFGLSIIVQLICMPISGLTSSVSSECLYALKRMHESE